jgi:hypothetical protein
MADMSQIKKVPPDALAAYRAHRGTIVQTTVALAMHHHDEVTQHGEQAEHLLTAGLDYTTQALEVAMALHDLDMLEYQLQWGNERLPHDGVQPRHLLRRYEILARVIETTLGEPHAQAVNQFVGWMIARQRELTDAQGE